MGELHSSTALVAPLWALATAEEDLRRIRLLEDVDFAALRSAADEFAAVAAAQAAAVPALRGLFSGDSSGGLSGGLSGGGLPGVDPHGGPTRAASCAIVEPLAVRCRGAGAAVEAHAGWAARMAGRLRSAVEQAETAISVAANRALDAHAGIPAADSAGQPDPSSGQPTAAADRPAADALSVLRSELDRAAAELAAIWDRLVHELGEPAPGGVTLGGTSGRSVDRSTGVRLGELPDGPAVVPAPVAPAPAAPLAPEWIGETSGG